MPSPYLTKRSKLCQHVEYYTGCLSCRAEDAQSEIDEAAAEVKEREKAIDSYTALLKQSEIRSSERERFAENLRRATEDCAAWSQRCDALGLGVVSCQQRVRSLCDATELAELAEASDRMQLSVRVSSRKSSATQQRLRLEAGSFNLNEKIRVAACYSRVYIDL